ncbi:hypothetical protein [Streptomyces peucetius]|uniref:Uncharacterized protein n=1 Tax=Streptomyces peucetius TaxID=1950 RepID=A0ABY6HZZ9_STRPE|nr:hypothetical protein [Streptomyces peucetius]UYQ60301.1 hypothetical protein OGH68_01650 [Streptomyces peucetius]
MNQPTSAPPLFERPLRTGEPLFASGRLPTTESVLEELGDRGRHARIALGVTSAPFGACVETEMVVEC